MRIGVTPWSNLTVETYNLRRGFYSTGLLATDWLPFKVSAMTIKVIPSARNTLSSFTQGDLPGISVVMIDGEMTVAGRSQQTPPPERSAIIERKRA